MYVYTPLNNCVAIHAITNINTVYCTTLSGQLHLCTGCTNIL